MKNAIFSYYNFQINPEIVQNQKKVIDKLIEGTGITYHQYFYNAKDGDVYPDQVINFGVQNIFYTDGFDNVLVLDIDCIPLSADAINYMFHRASSGYLIGNAQRSHYIENDKHIFIGSSCICFSKETFEKLGNPNFCPTDRGDIAEEFVWLAEEKNLPIEFFVPQSYQASPYGAPEWELDGIMKPYGIGTTFERQDNKEAMFYHLFESRTNLHVDKFVAKCNEVLNT